MNNPNNSTLFTRLKTHFKRAKVPNIGFHGFRHTHASLLLNAGIPYKELQHRLGHSTLSMTMDTYSHLSKESAKKPFHSRNSSREFVTEQITEQSQNTTYYDKQKPYNNRLSDNSIFKLKDFMIE